MLDNLRIVRDLMNGLEPHLVAWQMGATEKVRREALSLANSAAQEMQAIINRLKPTCRPRRAHDHATNLDAGEQVGQWYAVAPAAACLARRNRSDAR